MTMEALRSLSFYYLGLPRPDLPERRLFWSGERHMAALLRSGQPVVVAMVVPGCRFSEPFKDEFKLAAAQMAPRGVHFVQVDCSEAEEYCTSRRPDAFPTVEVYVPSRERTPDGRSITRLRILPFDYHLSAYGMRCFLQHHKLLAPAPS